jgi:hypothetical protein
MPLRRTPTSTSSRPGSISKQKTGIGNSEGGRWNKEISAVSYPLPPYSHTPILLSPSSLFQIYRLRYSFKRFYRNHVSTWIPAHHAAGLISEMTPTFGWCSSFQVPGLPPIPRHSDTSILRYRFFPVSPCLRVSVSAFPLSPSPSRISFSLPVKYDTICFLARALFPWG